MPFWVNLATSLVGSKPRSGIFSILSAMRMLRVLKLSRLFEGSIVIAETIERSAQALCVPLFFLAVAVVVFATFTFYLEREMLMGGEEYAFASVPHAIWFMIVTMTTVGYGDVTPSSTIGRGLTILAMIFGVLFLSMPLAIVGNNFCIIWEDKERLVFIHRLREKFSQVGIDKDHVMLLFEDIDTNGSGYINQSEFRDLLKVLHINYSVRQAKDLFHAIDHDGSGEICRDEFLVLFFDHSLDEDDGEEEEVLGEGGEEEGAVEEAAAATEEKTGESSGKVQPIAFVGAVSSHASARNVAETIAKKAVKAPSSKEPAPAPATTPSPKDHFLHVNSGNHHSPHAGQIGYHQSGGLSLPERTMARRASRSSMRGHRGSVAHVDPLTALLPQISSLSQAQDEIRTQLGSLDADMSARLDSMETRFQNQIAAMEGRLLAALSGQGVSSGEGRGDELRPAASASVPVVLAPIRNGTLVPLQSPSLGSTAAQF